MPPLYKPRITTFYPILAEMDKSNLFINMMDIDKRKSLVEVIYQGNSYLEWDQVLEVIKVPSSTLYRLIRKGALLKDEHIFFYKNRKLIQTEWAINFWVNYKQEK